MISRKKRQRYRTNAIKIAQEHGFSFPESWEEVWSILDQYPEPEYLYVIGELGGKYAKIGRSKNPQARLKMLQTGFPVPLRLWGFCNHVSPFTEREVHQKLKDFKEKGEWFRVSDEVNQTISQIRSFRVI